MALESLQDLYLEQLKDLHSAERQIIEALPKMIAATTHPELRQAFEKHLRQTEEQLRRLEQIGKRAGQDLSGHKCKGMEGLLEEGKELMEERADSDVLDAALIRPRSESSTMRWPATAAPEPTPDSLDWTTTRRSCSARWMKRATPTIA